MLDVQELKDMGEKELLSHLDKENMVDLISIGKTFRAEDIFEAALKMTKINMTWLRNHFRYCKKFHIARCGICHNWKNIDRPL